MASRLSVGHRIFNGDSLCSFINHLGRPKPSAPTSKISSYRKAVESVSPVRSRYSPSFTASTSDSSSRATTSRNHSPRASTTCSGRSDRTTHLNRRAETDAIQLLVGYYASDTDPAPSVSAYSSPSTSCYVPTTPQSKPNGFQLRSLLLGRFPPVASRLPERLFAGLRSSPRGLLLFPRTESPCPPLR